MPDFGWEVYVLSVKNPDKVCLNLLNVKLYVNNILIDLNPFVRNIIKNVIEGLVSSLKGIPKEIKKIVVEIEK